MSNGYNPKIDASLPVSFFAAAYRFGHSLLPSTIEQWSVTHKHICKFSDCSAQRKEIDFVIFDLASFQTTERDA